MHDSRVRRLLISIFGLEALALVGALVALGLGVAPRRLCPVAGFLALGVGSAVWTRLSARAGRQRARRLRSAALPRGIVFRKPLWMRFDYPMIFVALVALPGALLAAVGAPSVGLGMLVVALAIVGLPSFMSFDLGESLAFDDEGLRLGGWRMRCLVPWVSITNVAAFGPEHSQLVELDFDELDGVVASVLPDTVGNRKRLRDLLGRPGQTGGHVMLFPWAGGLDGPTLERAIRDGMVGRKDAPN